MYNILVFSYNRIVIHISSINCFSRMALMPVRHCAHKKIYLLKDFADIPGWSKCPDNAAGNGCVIT